MRRAAAPGTGTTFESDRRGASSPDTLGYTYNDSNKYMFKCPDDVVASYVANGCSVFPAGEGAAGRRTAP